MFINKLEYWYLVPSHLLYEHYESKEFTTERLCIPSMMIVCNCFFHIQLKLNQNSSQICNLSKMHSYTTWNLSRLSYIGMISIYCLKFFPIVKINARAMASLSFVLYAIKHCMCAITQRLTLHNYLGVSFKSVEEKN